MRPPKPSSRSQKTGLIVTLVLLAIAAPIAALSPWALSAALIVVCGVCVAFEFALVKIPVRKLERDAEAGVSGAGILVDMKRDMNAMLAACQFGITLSSLGLTLALEPAIHHALVRFPAIAAYSVALAMGLGAFFHVTLGELVPKGLALVVPGKVLYVTAPFMRMFRILAVPFIKTCNSIANVIVQGVTGKNPDVDAHHEENVDIGEALLYAHASGKIRTKQLQLMRNVLSFTDRSAREVMTPARAVIALDVQSSWAENLALAEEHGFSRFPVVDGEPHNLTGYVRRADLLAAEIKGQRVLAALLRPIDRRPETTSLGRLNLFHGTPMIALFDEHDTFAGLLTAEDVVEQIVGEIYDETDERKGPELVTLEDGSVRMSGQVLLEAAADALGVPDVAQHEDVDTISGLIVKMLARQPRKGDELDLGPYRASVEDAKGFRIASLLFRRRPE